MRKKLKFLDTGQTLKNNNLILCVGVVTVSFVDLNVLQLKGNNLNWMDILQLKLCRIDSISWIEFSEIRQIDDLIREKSTSLSQSKVSTNK